VPVHKVTPILNVSDIQASFEWFAKLGWNKVWDWGEPPDFGGIRAGRYDIFLCQDGQGGRGSAKNESRTRPPEKLDQTDDQGVWLFIDVDDADAVHARCIEHGLDVVIPPTDRRWGSREMLLRHPDGHNFRIAHGIG
jgi:catechol 2,3-dioxygenase-like lactoylglutathione lyase family enzyme